MRIFKSPLEMLYERAGVPHMQAGGSPPAVGLPASSPPMPAIGRYGMMGGVDDRPFVPVQGYRADPTGRFGGKDRMETQPTTYNREIVDAYIKAMRAGQPLGVPQLTPDQLMQMLLTEGRSDFGFNMLNENNKKAMHKAEVLNEMGHSKLASDFAAALYDKQQMANRLNRPLQEVWNGLGRSSAGRTGAQHNQRFNEFGYAVDNPKNAELMNVVNEAYNYRSPEKLNLGANEYADPMGNFVPTTEPNKPGGFYATGGSVAPKSFYDMSKMLIQKHLSGK